MSIIDALGRQKIELNSFDTPLECKRLFYPLICWLSGDSDSDRQRVHTVGPSAVFDERPLPGSAMTPKFRGTAIPANSSS